jgi:hypothetical protein
MNFGRTCLLGFLLQFCGAGSFLHAEAMRQAGAVVCAPGKCGKIELDSTDRAPGAHGAARLQRTNDAVAVDVELGGLKPATLFGGDYNTYVLWAVSPDDEVENLGEFLLNGTRSRLHGSTRLTTFAIVVTAEPHFLVENPSPFIVLHSPLQERGRTVSYPVLQGIYNFERDTLDDVKRATGVVYTGVKQALTAVRLAERSGAAELANTELIEAERALDVTMDLLHQGRDRDEIEALARETVRLAVAVQNLALARAFQNARVE